MDSGVFPGKYPAIVRHYDAESRLCRVEIPGITDSGDVLPLADIEYSIGDKSRQGAWETEIEILAGDTVWVTFIEGDSRYPLITGYRNPSIGNAVGHRRIHHANIDLTADSTLTITAAKIIISGSVEIHGKTAIDGSALTHNGKNVGSDHKHGGIQSGGSNTGTPT
jgi:phage baseplate assembly protein gpV